MPLDGLPPSSVQRRVDLIEIEEFGDLSQRPSRHMVMDQMRFGKPLEEFDPDRRKTHLFGEYQPPLTVLADAAGFAVDDWTATGGAAAAREDTTIVSGEIKAGTAAAQKVVITGRADGAEVVKFTQYAYVTMDTDPAWDLRPTGWRVRVHGDAPFDIDMASHRGFGGGCHARRRMRPQGDTSHWAPNLVRDNSYVDPPADLDEGYHLTEDLADEERSPGTQTWLPRDVWPEPHRQRYRHHRNLAAALRLSGGCRWITKPQWPT